VVIITNHSSFDYEALQRVGKVVVDTRNAIAAPGLNVTRLGGRRRDDRSVTAEELLVGFGTT
jgi:hypothetical protein